MQFPRINLNGTDGKVLLAEYRTAYETLATAIHEVEAITVHGRDYQTAPDYPMAQLRARDEHHERIRKLRGVMEELAEIAINLNDQLMERSRA